MSRKVPEGWAKAVIGDFVEQFKRLNKDEDLAPLSVTKDRGIILQSEKYTKTIATGGGRNYKILRKGEYAYDPMSLYYGAIGRLTSQDRGVVSPAYITFRLKAGINPSFFSHYTKTKAFIADVNRVTTGGNMDGKRKKTDWDSFCSLAINLPPLSEQRQIADILSSVDDAIAAMQAVIGQTRTVKQGVLKRLLTRGIGHVRFKKTEIGEIPETWEVRSLEELGQVQAGRQRSPHFTEGTLRPYLRVANVFDGFVDTSDVLKMKFTESEYERYRLEPGDILLNEGQSLELVGRNAVYEGEPADCCFQNTLIRFRSGPDVQDRFAYALMQNLFLTGKFMSIATRTTSVAHLGVKRFASLLVPLPPKNEQSMISELHDQFTQTQNSQMQKYKETVSLKAALMSDLLTGRKRVSADTLSPAL